MNLNSLPNPQIAVIAVARLGGDVKAIDSEDAAIVAYEIAPKKFCWRKHPDRIDLSTVHYALQDAAKPEMGLLVGNMKDGWMLSPKAVDWIANLPQELKSGAEGKAKRGSVLTAQEAERTRLHRTVAFLKFQSGNAKTISVIECHEFLRINEYFSLKKRNERFKMVENAVAGDPELMPLWDFLKAEFKKEISPDENQN